MFTPRGRISNKIKKPSYNFKIDVSLNITETDIVTHLYDTSSNIIENNSSRIFLYYFVESIPEDCIHPEKGNLSEKSIVLSLPQLYLFPESYVMPKLESFEEIQKKITINDVIIEPYTTNDSTAKYMLKSIYLFQKEFCYIENIRTSLTVNEIHKLLDKDHSTQHGGEKDIQDVYYKTHYGTLLEKDAHDHVPYDLLQKLGIDKFNSFLPTTKPTSEKPIHHPLPNYTNLFSNYFTKNKDTNTKDTIRHEYITRSLSTRYFTYLFDNIKEHVVKYITPIFSTNESMFRENVIHIVPNKTIARYLCVWFLVEKWIDLYITNKFNLQLYTITKNVQTENIQTETSIDENQYHIIKTTFEYKLEIIKQQLSMFILPSEVERIFNNINNGLHKAGGIKSTYNTYSYYQLIEKELTSFLEKSKENSTQGQIKKLEKEIATIGNKIDTNNNEPKTTKIKQSLKNENMNLLLEIDRLKNEIQHLKDNSTQDITKPVIKAKLEIFGEYLGKWFREIDISDYDTKELVELFKKYIVEFVYENRKRSGQDIYKELQVKLNKEIRDILLKNNKKHTNISEDEKLLVHTNIRRTLDTILYLLQTVLKDYIALPEPEQKPVNTEIPKTTQQSPEDQGFEIDYDSDDDFGIDNSNIDYGFGVDGNNFNNNNRWT